MTGQASLRPSRTLRHAWGDATAQLSARIGGGLGWGPRWGLGFWGPQALCAHVLLCLLLAQGAPRCYLPWTPGQRFQPVCPTAHCRDTRIFKTCKIPDYLVRSTDP